MCDNERVEIEAAAAQKLEVQHHGWPKEPEVCAAKAEDYAEMVGTLWKNGETIIEPEEKFNQFAQHFHSDLEHWISEVSEVFHWRIFFVELVGHFAFSIFGPFSTPLLFLCYGTKIGLENRGFWIFKVSPPMVFQLVIWLLFAMAIVAYCAGSRENLMIIEPKFAAMCLFLRNLPIATKYAYCSTETWMSHNTKHIEFKYRTFQNMIPGWYIIPQENFEIQAEVAFIGVLGSKEQREEFTVRFLPWPQNGMDLFLMRKRIDVTSRTMFLAPTGDISNPDSWRRKPVRRRIIEDSSSPRDSPELDNSIKTLKNKMSRKSLGQMRSFVLGGEKKEGRKTMCEQAEVEKHLFQVAAAGGEVGIEDLFLYILKGISYSEKAFMPPLQRISAFFTLITVLLPSFLRWRNSGRFLGPDPLSVLFVVGVWPSNFICLWSSMLFIAVGAVDMWRRRALMRSCAAMISVQREFRRHCPAEVDMLPVLNLAHAPTVAGWRKLRQLCTEWGKFYQSRIRAFSAQFFFFLLVILTDLICGMLIPAYTEFSGVNLASLLVCGLVSTALVVCIITLVHLGNEVNKSAERHRFLINRQRTLLTAIKHEASTSLKSAAMCAARSEAQKNSRMPPDPCQEELEKTTDLMACLSDELECDGNVRPLTLLGMPLGWSLISFLNFIPIGVISTLMQFCGNEETAQRCLA